MTAVRLLLTVILAGFPCVASAQTGGQANVRPAPATLQDDPNHPPSTQGWVETRLYFGLRPADAPTRVTTEAGWQSFLDHEVTPRFPAGLSVLDVYGQWQSKGGATTPRSTPMRIRSKLLIIYYPRNPENDARIEEIRAAWKTRTGDQSVLKATSAVEVSF